MPAIKGSTNIRRAKRYKDVKYYVERGLEDMGYMVNGFRQEKIAPNECVVTIESCSFDVETTATYWGDVGIRITMAVDDNNEIPYVIAEIMSNVTDFVEKSGAPWCTSFRFLQPHIYEDEGETHRIDFPCVYSQEIAWVD